LNGWDPPAMEGGHQFSLETGEVTVRRWKIGVTLYLIFTAAGAVFEGLYHPARTPLLLVAVAAQALVIAGAWLAIMHRPVHPRTAWIVLLSGTAVCLIVAVYNAAVDGDMLYVLLTYITFMLVVSLLVPWGAGFQLALDAGAVLSYGVGVWGGGRVGPMPAYDYTAIVATTVFSTLGALYIDRYRRQLFTHAAALREANQHLQAANRTRTELLSGLSHDMRTPLAVLIGYGDLLAENPALADELISPVRSIQREARQLLALVDGVLDLARLEAGRLPFERTTFQLAVVLDPLRETTEDQLHESGVRLRWSVARSLELDSDPGKVREIVRNLLSNAVKYTQQGEISLVAASTGDGIEITVSDTGVGIAKEDLDQIFNAFQRVASDFHHGLGGLGFGLYLVRMLVRLVGGRIGVQSVPGSGSTFRLWLPPHPPLVTGAPAGPPLPGGGELER
jgi:signal transduction histidine kinase